MAKKPLDPQLYAKLVKAEEDLEKGTISRRDFNKILALIGAATGATVAEMNPAYAWVATRMRKKSSTSASSVAQYSLRMSQARSTYLSCAFASAPTSSTTGTWSVWFKRGRTGYGYSHLWSSVTSDYEAALFDANDKLQIEFANTSIVTTRIFRDTTAWSHLVVAVDTTQAAAPNRVRVFVNGEQITSFTGSYPAQNATAMRWVQSGKTNFIGADTTYYGDNLLSEFYYVDGQALSANSFGQFDGTTGQWTPKQYAGTFGTNGFYLPFKSATAVNGTGTAAGTYPSVTGVAGLGADFSGNNRHWSGSALTVDDQFLDSPANNFCTLSPLAKSPALPLTNFSANNTKVTSSGVGAVWYGAGATHGVKTGKWYYEVDVTGFASQSSGIAGFCTASLPWDNATADSFGLMAGHYFRNDAGAGYQYLNFGSGATITAGTNSASSGTYMIALDLDNNRLYLGKDGTWSNSANPGAGTGSYSLIAPGEDVIPFFAPCRDDVGGLAYACQFGQGGSSGLTYNSTSGGRFKFTPPTGFKALSSANLSTPSILKPSQYFASVLYSAASDTLLLHMDGTNGGTTFADDASHSISVAGVGVTTSTSQKKFGTSSGSFNGNGYLNLGDSADWQFGSGDFTVEFFLYRTGDLAPLTGPFSSKNACVLSYAGQSDTTPSYSWWIGVNSSGANHSVSGYFNAGTVASLSYNAVPLNQWVHYAFVRTNGVVNFYVDGILADSQPIGTGAIQVPGNSPLLSVGADNRYISYGWYLIGNLDEVRVTKGLARYTSNFTPPSAPFTLTTSSSPFSTGFQPDLLWIKDRTSATNHVLIDSVRGATKYLSSNLTNAETADATVVSAFTTTGATLGTSSLVNGGGEKYLALAWKKGATPGFDVVQAGPFTDASGTVTKTISHSLGAVPHLIIAKASDNASGWSTWHRSLPAGNYLDLSSTNGPSVAGSGSHFSNLTSTTFDLGTWYYHIGNNRTAIFYLWTEVPGFSKFGSYVGNGSADGPFVHCGFKPKFILIKSNSNISSTGWMMWDTSLSSANSASDSYLRAETNGGVYTGGLEIWDCYANGFKPRYAGGWSNGSGVQMVYIAFAESPFKYSLAR